MRMLSTIGVVVVIGASVLLGGASSALAQSCGGSDHLISAGHSGLVILRESHASCRTVERLGQALLRQMGPRTMRHPLHVNGFTCRAVTMRGGQRAVSCLARHRQMVLFGLE